MEPIRAAIKERRNWTSMVNKMYRLVDLYSLDLLALALVLFIMILVSWPV
jgi:hypothetical protein